MPVRQACLESHLEVRRLTRTEGKSVPPPPPQCRDFPFPPQDLPWSRYSGGCRHHLQRCCRQVDPPPGSCVHGVVIVSPKSRAHYRVVVMGAAAVGKSAIISQFLYDRFVKEYKATVEDLHRGEYDVNGMHLILDILDTSGTHSFPAMRKLAIATGDAFVLVYSVDDDSSFSAVKQLRDEIMEEKNSEDVPIVIAANKTDVTEERRVIGRETAETLVCIEWGNGYIEASAKDNINIVGIFKEILRQSNIQYALSPAVRRRRRSMPAVLVQRRQLDPQKDIVVR